MDSKDMETSEPRPQGPRPAERQPTELELVDPALGAFFRRLESHLRRIRSDFLDSMEPANAVEQTKIRLEELQRLLIEPMKAELLRRHDEPPSEPPTA